MVMSQRPTEKALPMDSSNIEELNGAEFRFNVAPNPTLTVENLKSLTSSLKINPVN
jgi:hypothetical protein